MPGAKAQIKLETFSGALKRSFPRMNAGAPTQKNVASAVGYKGGF